MKFVLFNAVVGAALGYLILAERGSAPTDGVSASWRSMVEAVAPPPLPGDLPVPADPDLQAPPPPLNGPAAPVSAGPGAPGLAPALAPSLAPADLRTAQPAPVGSAADPAPVWLREGPGRDLPIEAVPDREVPDREMPGRDLPDRLRDLARSMESRFLAGMK